MKLVLAALALIWAAMLWLGGADGDRAVLAFLYAGDNPGWGRAARMITELGSFPVVMSLAAIGGLLLARRGQIRAALLLVALPLTSGIIVETLKRWIGRLRPHDQEHMLVEVQSYAFPSGHTTNATVVWLGLALLLVRGGRARPIAIAAAALLAVAIGLSRNMLGVHWPSDVVGGWTFGLFWILVLARLTRVPLSAS
ncbi:MAG TPA: phosphatase PAP2 family protein [Allosphingosinicella sp.]|nr:phosphatase PAP2 family protein [Allosphingosinicella sp.]